MARSFNDEEGEMSIKQTDRRATPTGAVILASGNMNKLQGFGLSNFQKT